MGAGVDLHRVIRGIYI